MKVMFNILPVYLYLMVVSCATTDNWGKMSLWIGCDRTQHSNSTEARWGTEQLKWQTATVKKVFWELNSRKKTKKVKFISHSLPRFSSFEDLLPVSSTDLKPKNLSYLCLYQSLYFPNSQGQINHLLFSIIK